MTTKIIELRVGNTIFIDGFTTNVTEEHLYNFNKIEVEGICLNEKFLLKLGFKDRYNRKNFVKKHNTKGAINFKDNYFRVSGVDTYPFLDICKKDKVLIHIEQVFFVHELQNIYYALTGDELKYNEL